MEAILPSQIDALATDSEPFRKFRCLTKILMLILGVWGNKRNSQTIFYRSNTNQIDSRAKIRA